jgi:hypothetical protein
MNFSFKITTMKFQENPGFSEDFDPCFVPDTLKTPREIDDDSFMVAYLPLIKFIKRECNLETRLFFYLIEEYGYGCEMIFDAKKIKELGQDLNHEEASVIKALKTLLDYRLVLKNQHKIYMLNPKACFRATLKYRWANYNKSREERTSIYDRMIDRDWNGF